MTSEEEFPQQLRDYIAYIEKETSTPITIVSVGPDRAQTIIRK
ncbi:MAG: adenylosuccinate synthetase [Bacteroidaceae bacterium]|nr:adenylosuccinate synthetase [Paraprevotella sp.]MDY2716563.1 adenylosuccinate synthetase [Bacteroidaceae bacterium]